MTPFAWRLKWLRERWGISQSRLSREINVDHSIVSRWEAGLREPTYENALASSKFLGDKNESLVIAAGYLPSWLRQEIDQDRLDRVLLELADTRALVQREPELIARRIHLLTVELTILAREGEELHDQPDNERHENGRAPTHVRAPGTPVGSSEEHADLLEIDR